MKKTAVALYVAMALAAPIVRGDDAPDLFVDYAEVKSGSTTCIKTGLTGGADIKAEIVLEYVAVENRVFFGAKKGTGNNLYFLGTDSSKNPYMGYGTNVYAYLNGKKPALSTGVKYKIETELAKGRQSMVITNAGNGDLVGSCSASSEAAIDNPREFYFFRYNKDGSLGSQTQCRFYSMKVWQVPQGGGDYELVREYVPALKDAKVIIWEKCEEKAYETDFTSKKCWVGLGDGRSWSDARNWLAMPEPDEPAYIDTTAGELAISNDVTGLSLSQLIVTGGNRLTLEGNPITLTKGGVFSGNSTALTKAALYVNSGDVTFNVPVTFAASGKQSLGLYNSTLRFRRPVTLASTVTEFCASPITTEAQTDVMCFHDTLSGASTVFHSSSENCYTNGTYGAGVDVHFFKPVSLRRLRSAGDDSEVVLYASGNAISDGVSVGYKGKIHLYAENAVPASGVVAMMGGSASSASDTSCMVNLGGFDQTMNCLDLCPETKINSTEQRSVRSIVPGEGNTALAGATLTLKGTRDALCAAHVRDAVSLVWDPVGAFTQAFSNQVNDTCGTISVKGGTFLIGCKASFPNVPSVVISANATLGIAADAAAGALAGVSDIRIAGRLEIASGAPGPFADGHAVLQIADGGKVAAPGGVTVAGVRYGGAYLADGQYSNVDWIDGNGTVTVDSSNVAIWKSAADGAWDEPSNWVGGAVPTSSQAVHLTVDSAASYTVSVSAIAEISAKTHVENLGGGTATLAVKAKAACAGSGLWLGKGGRMTVPEQGDFTYNGKGVTGSRYVSPVCIAPGGELLVCGGNVTFTNYVGMLSVSGSGSDTGRVAVSSGRLTLSCSAPSSGIALAPGGEVLLTGGTMKLINVHTSKHVSPLWTLGGRFEATGGTLDQSGSVIENPSWPNGGEFRVGGTAVSLEDAGVDYSRYLRPGHEGGVARLTIDGSATYAGNSKGTMYLNGGLGGKAILTLDSPANDIKFGYSLRLGANLEDAGFGQLDLMSGYAYVRHRGIMVGGTSSRVYPILNEGLLRIRSGVLDVDSATTAGWTSDYMGTLAVGYGLKVSAEAVSRTIRGTVEMSGGSVTNRNNHTVVGAGFATGNWSQSGGETVLKKGLWVGFAHGVGRFVLSGGKVSVAGNLLAGGAFTNDVLGAEVAANLVDAGWPIDRHDAEGTVRVSDGSLSVAGTAGLGYDGIGTFEIAGSKGVVSLGGLVLSNAVLRFTADADGVTPIKVKGAMSIAPDAKIEVDLSGLSSERRVKLVSFASCAGAFAADNVKVIPADIPVMVNSKGVYAGRPNGVVLIVR